MSLCRCTWCPCVDALYVLSDEEPDSRGIPCPNSTETNLPHQKLKFILDKNAGESQRLYTLTGILLTQIDTENAGNIQCQAASVVREQS